MWHLLQALRAANSATPADTAFLDSLLAPVAHLGDLSTPGQPWPKVRPSLSTRMGSAEQDEGVKRMGSVEGEEGYV